MGIGREGGMDGLQSELVRGGGCGLHVVAVDVGGVWVGGDVDG